MMLKQLYNRNLYFVMGGDLALLIMALYTSYQIRFEFALPEPIREQFFAFLPVMLIIKIVFFVIFGVYKGIFRYASIADMWRIFKAVGVSSLLILSGILILYRFEGYSRAVFLLDGFLSFLFVGGWRLGIRTFFHKHQEQKLSEGHFYNPFKERPGCRSIIVGAGNTGEKTLREIIDNPRLNYHVEGFVDDDPHKQWRMIHGIPVIGKVDALPAICEKLKVEHVIIAAPSATGDQMRRIVAKCKESGVQFKTLPGLAELIDGKVNIKALRDVNYRDLLRREPVVLDEEGIEGYLKQKTVLVTGAGGSIGSELCRQLVRFSPKELVLFDSSEPNLYNIQMELKHRVGYQRYYTVLGSVADEELAKRVFQKYKPNVVFHAAAYKHVPMIERNPWQAVTNNLRGTQVVLEQAVNYGASHFVLVSTDKAVRPTNVMGCSKRICELLLAVTKGGNTQIMTVRFGNVVGSAGSVVPLFRDQIQRGGPVTVTHPDVTRFFMTIPEAAQLILQAGALGKGGETFILDMGIPIKIVDLARDLIRLSGKEPDKEIEVIFTGLRSGEKLYEELITDGEGIVGTQHKKIMVLKSDGNWNGHNNQEDSNKWLMQLLGELYEIAGKYDACAIREKMKEIVPEYMAKDTECAL